MASEEPPFDVYECPSCGELRFQEGDPCCGRALETVDVPTAFEHPSVKDVVGEIFDISSTELAICRELMAAEEATIKELARELPRDRSIVQRHVTHLHDLDLVERRSQSLVDGGRVNVYAPKSVDEIRQRLQLGLYAWVHEADTLLEELTREKFEAMAERAASSDGDARSTVTPREMVVDNGGSKQPSTGDDRSMVARLLDRLTSR